MDRLAIEHFGSHVFHSGRRSQVWPVLHRLSDHFAKLGVCYSGAPSNNPVGANRRLAFQFGFWHKFTLLVFRAVAHPGRYPFFGLSTPRIRFSNSRADDDAKLHRRRRSPACSNVIDLELLISSARPDAIRNEYRTFSSSAFFSGWVIGLFLFRFFQVYGC